MFSWNRPITTPSSYFKLQFVPSLRMLAVQDSRYIFSKYHFNYWTESKQSYELCC